MKSIRTLPFLLTQSTFLTLTIALPQQGGYGYVSNTITHQGPQTFGNSNSQLSTFNSIPNTNPGTISSTCKSKNDGKGNFHFSCDDPKLQYKIRHILWLKKPLGSNQNITIDVPNYKIWELIQAAYKKKTQDEGSTNININVQKPTHDYEARAETLKGGINNPNVNLKYEPIQDSLIHYPHNSTYKEPFDDPPIPPYEWPNQPGQPGQPQPVPQSSGWSQGNGRNTRTTTFNGYEQDTAHSYQYTQYHQVPQVYHQNQQFFLSQGIL